MMTFDDDCFTIRIEPARKFVEIALKGYWSRADAERFERTLRQQALPALVRGGCALNDQVTLFDDTDFLVQSQEVVAMLGAMTADRSIGSRRIAVVLSSAILKRQTQRIAPDYGVFGDRDEALRWLFEPVS